MAHDFYHDTHGKDAVTDDIEGHGTHVAGIIGAKGNNGVGVSGVCWNVAIVPMQASNGTGDKMIQLCAVRKAFTYAVDNNIPILNCSFGDLHDESDISDYVEIMKDYKGLIVCSAGNKGVNTDVNLYLPSCTPLENIISVANATSLYTLASDSNFGVSTVDIAAPGTDIYSTVPTSVNSSGYKLMSGTSMAAPFVSGVAALILSKHPGLSGTQLKYLLTAYASGMSELNGKVAGSRFLNAQAAVNGILRGWQNDGYSWYYYGSTGVKVKGWQIINSKTYYFDPTNGNMITGWKTINSKFYYFEPAGSDPTVSDYGKMYTGWKTISGKKYYFEPSNGSMSTGWKTISEKFYYFDPTGGSMITGMKIINGKTYYFDTDNGSMITGWKKIGDKFYYFESTGSNPANSKDDYGRICTGWKIINGKTYYFITSGNHPTVDSNSNMCSMVTGWKVIKSKTYYFEPNGNDPADSQDDYGRICTGWKIINNRTRYFETDGDHPVDNPDSDMCSMVTGWRGAGDDRRYFEESGINPIADPDTELGRLVYGRHTGNNGKIEYDSTGWIKVGGLTYYLNPEGDSPANNPNSNLGKMRMGLSSINGAYYYLRPYDGAMCDGLMTLNIAHPEFTYYFCPTGKSPAEDPYSDLGKAMSGWINIGENRYYFDPVTKRGSLGLKTIDGLRYYFDPDSGIMQTGWHCLQDTFGDNVKWVAYYFDESTGVLTDAWHDYEYVLADNSWEQIKKASEFGLASHIWHVGDEKSFVLSTGETVTVQIYGFNHDDLTDGGKAGITFGLKKILRQAYALNDTATNAYGYAGMDFYQWINTTMFSSLPEELYDAVKLINKKTSAGGGSTEIQTNCMYLFLFSEVECFGRTYHSVEGEGEQYEIFTDDASRIKTQPDLQIIEWWLRSPRKDDTSSFCIVHSTGHAGYVNAAWPYAGLCFGFCV